MKLELNSVKLIDLSEPGKKIEYAGKVCYKSQGNITDTSYERFITNIVKSGHHSVLEHEGKMFCFDRSLYEASIKPMVEYNHYLTFTEEGNCAFVSGNIRAWLDFVNSNSGLYMEGISTKLSKDYPYIFKNYDIGLKCDYGYEAEKKCKELDKHKIYTFEINGTRSFTHQIVRHRTLSFSQESQRYCNYTSNKFDKSIRVIMPEFEEDKFNDVRDSLLKIEDLYFRLVESGIKPEDARQVLPNCCASTIVVSGTLYNWKKFLHLRMDKHAQKEIRDIANCIASYLHITKEEVGAE